MARTVLIEGMDEIIERLSDVQQIAGDLRPVWDELGPIMARRQESVFASRGFGSWQINAQSTIAEHQSPLVDEGVMKDGLTQGRPIWSVKASAAYGAEKSDRRVMNIAVLNTVGHKSTLGNPHTPPRRVVPPLRAAEKRQVLEVMERAIMRAAG